MQLPPFLDRGVVRTIAQEHGTPVYVYDENTLLQSAQQVLAFPNAFGLTARYAMKALPNAAILRLFHEQGLSIDASSGFEVERAIHAGIPAEAIQLTAQQLPHNLKDLVEKGVWFNACSLHQLAAYGKAFPGTEVCVRINPGLGSGHNNRTNVGGPASSFGIWHEQLDEVISVAEAHQLKITRMHSHIGSGGDPAIWMRCAQMSLEIARRLPDVVRVNLGGGLKVGRMPHETSADIIEIGTAMKAKFEEFYEQHGRKLHLEIEPGTFLVANAGAVIASVIDVVNTGDDGYSFIKIDSGMTEVIRPSMYGAQHPMSVVRASSDEDAAESHYVIVGHCCESGDILSSAPGDPESLEPRSLTTAEVGDFLVIAGAGAYCASMAAKNYNSFPAAPEVLLRRDGSVDVIRKRESLEQIITNEQA